MEQAGFYNSLNIFFGGNYHRLSSLWRKYENWEIAYKNTPGARDPQKEMARLGSARINLILEDAPEFPDILKEIPYSPFGLYIKGNLPANPAIAIVGTRKASEEGASLAYEFGSFLSGRGITIISGLAFGVDKSAHEGALNSSGNTVAVLPGGLDSTYPSSHIPLADKILKNNGALVSEYPLGHKPTLYNFLERNRIISGLSKGVVIIEAPEVSGALATARFALEQNREVYVVPGPAKHRNYAGSHKLIKDGAALVTSPGDILENLGIPIREEEKLASLEEKAILKVLRSVGRPLNMEEIVELTGISAPIASQTISFLVLKSKVSENGTSFSIK